jgi:serine/threonine protein kinase
VVKRSQTSCKAAGFITPDVALPIALEMVAGLEAAHRAGVIHRDFKTANVFIERGEVKGSRRVVITDFGLARSVLAGQGQSSITGSDRIVGSPAYMAPEQVLGHTLTAQTDIYSLGVVLFEMITGRRPFLADSSLAVALRRLQEDPVRPSSLRPGLAAKWDATILRCLERDSGRRFADAQSVGLSLTSAATERTIPLPSKPEELSAAKNSSRRRLISLAAILALTLAWAAWNEFGASRRKPTSKAAVDSTVTIGVAPFNPLSSEARGEAETIRQLVFRNLNALIGERTGCVS